MANKRSLKVVPAEHAGLGLPTIMDRALAARYGTDYVHLAAFAIDVERVFQTTPDDAPLPFGWEVRLTEAYVLARLDPHAQPRHQSLLEDTCLGILEWRETPPPLGAQLTFAVFCLLERGLLPVALRPVFTSWRKPPVDLAQEMAERAREEGLVARLASHCLHAPLEPPLVAPVRDALVELGGS